MIQPSTRRRRCQRQHFLPNICLVLCVLSLQVRAVIRMRRRDNAQRKQGKTKGQTRRTKTVFQITFKMMIYYIIKLD